MGVLGNGQDGMIWNLLAGPLHGSGTGLLVVVSSWDLSGSYTWQSSPVLGTTVLTPAGEKVSETLPTLTLLFR